MLRPIPAQMLRQRAAVSVPVAVDRNHKATEKHIDVRRVCIQHTSKTVKGRDNTPVSLTALMFADARHTAPRLDWAQIKQQADSVGGFIRVNDGARVYTVMQVDTIQDDRAGVHHYEIGMV